MLISYPRKIQEHLSHLSSGHPDIFKRGIIYRIHDVANLKANSSHVRKLTMGFVKHNLTENSKIYAELSNGIRCYQMEQDANSHIQNFLRTGILETLIWSWNM